MQRFRLVRYTQTSKVSGRARSGKPCITADQDVLREVFGVGRIAGKEPGQPQHPRPLDLEQGAMTSASPAMGRHRAAGDDGGWPGDGVPALEGGDRDR